jgi:hypothetical protein
MWRRCGYPVGLAGVLVALAGCGTDLTPKPDDATWYGGVGPLIREKCAGCHHAGGIAPFSLYTYDDVHHELTQVLEALDTGAMPPFFAVDAPDCTPRYKWRDDPRLTDTELALIHTWADEGAPHGLDGSLPEPPSTTLENPTLSVRSAQGFTTSGDRDEFVCFLFDPQITSQRWLVASQVNPTAPEVVHHVNVQLVPPADAAAAIAQLGGFGVPSLGCGTAPGVPIQSWLPGNPALLLPTGVGIPVAAGTLISIQVHYHPAGAAVTDTSSVDLRLSDQAPAWTYMLSVYGNAPGPPHLLPDPDDPPSGPVFVIPANKPDHVETMDMQHGTLDRELRILGVTPHMHMLGTHERATVRHPDGTTECLIDSEWNFDWQRTYNYEAELGTLPIFDSNSMVEVSCHWNNTFDNPNMGRLLHDAGLVAPYDVTLGFQTTNEMCLADFGMITPN